MRIRLIAMDLDGTLLTRDSRLPEEHRAAIARARAAGVDLVLVTGRSWRGTRPFYQALGMTGPAICYLGALMVADGTGRMLRYRPLAAGAWEALRDFAVTERLAVTACMGTDQAVADGRLPAEGLVAADLAFATCPADDFRGWEDWNPYTEIAPDLAPCQVPPVMAAVYGDRAVRRVLERFPRGLPESQFDLSDHIAGETVLHVWHAGTNKGRALAEFCRLQGYRPEEVAAIGDAAMDISMVRFAGLGAAVPAADPALLAAADLVATPVELIDRVLSQKG